MRFEKTSFAFAAAALFAAPFAAQAAPSGLSFSSPTANSTVSGTLQGSTCELRGTNIARVNFYYDSTFIGSDTAGPWQCNVDTSKYPNGKHRVRAVAYDKGGAANDISVWFNVQNGTTSGGTTTNTPPTVSVTSPANGGTVSGTAVSCGASASDTNGIKQVQFFLDGSSSALATDTTSPYGCSFDSTKLSNGTHTLKAVATDGLNATSTAQISFSVSNTVTGTTNQAPTVSWKAPLNGQTISGTINEAACEALATDDKGVSKVQFFLGSTALNTEGGAPYNCTIESAKFANGAHVLKAVATDTNGATSSSQISINIQNGTTSTPTNSAPTVSWKAPLNGAKISGTIGESACEALATDSNGVQKVDFYVGNTLYRTEFGAPYTCGFDTKRFADGTHTLKAVATDKLGATNTAQIGVTIANGTSTTTNTPPTVALTSPASGSTLAGSVAYAATASDTGGSVTKVDFYLVPSTVTATTSAAPAFATKTTAPYSGTLDTKTVANGSYVLMAAATDNNGAVSTTQRAVSVNNQASSGIGGGGSGGASAIAASDIIFGASADVAFAQQSGYHAQAINTYTGAANIPESGIHGTTLPNGETLRFGKVSDPMNSAAKALAFQVINSDPTTSGGKRTELSVEPLIEHNKTYWIAFSVYVYDWGTLSSSDLALFGTQLHQGNNQLKVGGPAFGLYTKQNGRFFRVRGRYSEASTPSTSNAVNWEGTDHPMPFGKWTDFVLKFKENTSGNGLLQVWMDGNIIADYQGSLGYNTGYKDYIKFGYYNWSLSTMNSTARKLLMRSPTIVSDPTGSTYTPEQLRALVSGVSTTTTTTTGGTTTGGTTSSTGGTTTSSDSGVCSSALCVVTQ